jgi:argininosuccinate lyase
MSSQGRLWGGRFAGGPAEAFDRLNASLAVDRRLWPQDVGGSRAHARIFFA